jgi:hypothetical protein
MTAAHIIFIPGVLLVGIAFGYSLGARAVRAEMTRLRRRTKE